MVRLPTDEVAGEAGDMQRALNRQIGRRIMLARTLRGVSLNDIAHAAAVTCEQMQHFESGARAIGASQLFRISLAVDLPLEYFFQDLEGPARSWAPQANDGSTAEEH
jgi:transcriptional regulator with XRE-family HTH domain